MRRKVQRQQQQRGRVGRSPAAVGLVVLALSASGMAFKIAGGSGSDDAPDRPAAGAAAQNASDEVAVAFYRDVKRSMAPLVENAPLLSGLVKEVSGGQTPHPTVSNLATDWANKFATARDLVGRLHPRAPEDPEAPALYRARSVFNLGAALYVESARAVPHLVAVAGRTGERAEALKRVGRLQVLGDRAFDAGNRLVQAREAVDLGDGVGVDRLLPAEVPNFAELGLAAGGGNSAISQATPAEAKPAPITPDAWLAEHDDDVAEARRLLRESLPWVKAPGNAPPPAVQAAANRMEALTRDLDGPLPSSRLAAEGVHNLRLAILIASESLRLLPAEGGASTDPQQPPRLRLIAEELWGLATELLAGRTGSGSLYELPPSGLDPELLRSGGIFNGHPPALRPGDDPGKDVPDGLPTIRSRPPQLG